MKIFTHRIAARIVNRTKPTLTVVMGRLGDAKTEEDARAVAEENVRRELSVIRSVRPDAEEIEIEWIRSPADCSENEWDNITSDWLHYETVESRDV